MIATLVAVTMSANAQWFDFKNNVHRYEIGLNLGMTGINTGFEQFGWGASLSAWGVYLDFTSAGPMYKYDNRVASMNDPANLRFLPDSTTTTINLGYQIPVLPWLRVMPLVGYCQTNYGVTDMGTLNAETSENSTTLYHDYTVTPGSRKHYFNFGVGLSIRPVKYIDIYGVYSRRAIYGGISINLDAFVDDEAFYEE